MYLNPPLQPRDGHTLEVLSVRRVSDPDKQDERSLEDQGRLHEHWLEQRVDVPVNITPIAGSGSGELLGRDEYQQLLDAVSTGRFDVVIAEDLGRIVRRVHAVLVCEHCVDFDTRLIALNDNIDTACPGWQDSSIFSAWHHERSNRDTSDRIKRTHRSRFMSGGCLPTLIYGYVKPTGAKSDLDVRKDPQAEPIYKRWFEMLDGGATFAEVADWLNRTKVPVPPHARGTQWTGTIVGRITRNPLLKGVRERNRRKTKRNNASGRYVSVQADPEERLEREVPHLAFFEVGYYDRVLRKINDRNRRYRRSDEERHDPRRNIPRKRTRYPGQCIFCGICGRMYVFGGHGQRDHLMCDGARQHLCWNGATVDGPLAARRISAAIFAKIETLDGFDRAFLETVNAEANKLDAVRDQRVADLRREVAQAGRRVENLIAFVKDGDVSQAVRQELREEEAARVGLQQELAEVEAQPGEAVEIPEVDQLKALARETFEDLAVDDFEFARRLRALTPRIVVFPYVPCDGGNVVLRARFYLRLANLLPSDRTRDVLDRPLQRELVVELFDPPRRERIRGEVVRLRAEGYKQPAIAEKLGVTVTAVQRAVAMQAQVEQLAMCDPYVPVTEPSDAASRMRRHLHPRYRFDPLPDAGRL